MDTGLVNASAQEQAAVASSLRKNSGSAGANTQQGNMASLANGVGQGIAGAAGGASTGDQTGGGGIPTDGSGGSQDYFHSVSNSNLGQAFASFMKMASTNGNNGAAPGAQSNSGGIPVSTPIGQGGTLATAAGADSTDMSGGGKVHDQSSGGGGGGSPMSMMSGMMGGGGPAGDAGGGAASGAGDAMGSGAGDALGSVAAAFMNGGVVPDFMSAPPVGHYEKGGVVGYQAGGPVHDMHAGGFGVVPASTSGLPGYAGCGVVQGGVLPDYTVPYGGTSEGASSGGLVNVTGQEQQGLQNAVNVGSQIAANYRAGMNYAQQQNAYQKAAAAQEYARHLDELGSQMQDHELDDNGVPKNAQGVPAQPVQPTPSNSPVSSTPQADAALAGTAAVSDQNAPATPPAQGAIPVPSSQSTPALSAATNTPQAQQAAQASGVPTDATQAAATSQAVVGAAQASQASGGQPEQTPDQSGKKAHSISADTWNQWDKKIDDAVTAATAAGQDPNAVRQSLTASRTAWVQGHMVRNLSAAYTAMFNGDDKKLEQALRNTYYYVPDGQDMKIQKQDGKMVYQDPINPYVNDQGQVSYSQKPGYKPNMIPIDSQHLKLLGTAILNPEAVNDVIVGTRSAVAKAQLEAQEGAAKQTTAEAALNTSNANMLKGLAQKLKADTAAKLQPSQSYMHLTQAEKNLASATYLRWRQTQAGKENKLDGTALRGMQDASNAYDQIALGTKTVVPTQVPGKNGQMVPNLDPNAGKITYDTTKVPAALKAMSPEQHAAARARASDIYAANASEGMTPATAAALSVAYASGGKHPGQSGKNAGKPVDNVMVDEAKGLGHIWMNNHWVNFKLAPSALANKNQSAVSPDELASAVLAQDAGGSGTPAALPDPDENTPDFTNNNQ